MPLFRLSPVDEAIDIFHHMLHDLAHDRVTPPGKHANNFHLVDTRNTITCDRRDGHMKYTRLRRILQLWHTSS